MSVINGEIVVNFSGDVDQSTVDLTDLILSGSGLDSANPAHATGLTWIDSHTVEFMLSGGFNTSGAVNVSIQAASIRSIFNEPISGFSDTFQVTASTAGSTGTTSNPTLAVLMPSPAASPTHGKHHKKVKHPKPHPKPHHKPKQTGPGTRRWSRSSTPPTPRPARPSTWRSRSTTRTDPRTAP